MKQLELFNNLDKPGNVKSFKTEGRDHQQLWRFKRWLFLIIYSIIVLIIGFVLGAEHGKDKKTKDITPKDSRVAVIKTAKKASLLPPKSIAADYKYVIQVASFRKVDAAKKEKKSLKKKGFKAYIKQSKKFTAVLVGPFKSQQEARQKQKTLKKKYSDCFIKKIK